MTRESLVKWTGIANILAGFGTALFWFIHPDPSLVNLSLRVAALWKIDYGMFLAVLVLTLFALVGMLSKQIDRINLVGVFGYILAFAGTAILIGAGTFEGFVSPTLAASAQTQALLNPQGALISALLPIFMLGGICFALGYILFGIFIIQAKIFPPLAGILLIISGPILGLSPAMPPLARMIGSVIFGLANIWLGCSVWCSSASCCCSGEKGQCCRG